MVKSPQKPPLKDRLRELRDKAGLTQEQLAGRAGLTVSTVRKVEQGDVPDPRWHTVVRLAGALGVSLDNLAATTAEPEAAAARRPPKRP